MTREAIDELKARIDLVEAVRSSGVALKRAGKSWVGKCPLHPDDKPSLSVNPESQLWQCFGCQEGGDVFRFFERIEKLDFPTALERARVFAREVTPATRKRARAATGRAEPGLLERVAQLYRQALAHSREAQEYLERRGLGDPELWEAFGIGWADGTLRALLPTQGPMLEQLEVLGVFSGASRELMRGCVVVPLTHPSGQTLGLYGRAIQEGSEVPHRYLRGRKRGVLNWQAVRSGERLVIAESVLDALSLWQAGVREVTCLYGAGALPEDLETLLELGPVREVVWCLDGDAARREASAKLAARVADMRKTSLRVELPEGFDPNRVLVELGARKLAALVAAAVPMPANEPDAWGRIARATGQVPAAWLVPEPSTPSPGPARAARGNGAAAEGTRVAQAPPPEPPPSLEPVAECEEDHFRLTLDEVAYEVSPLGPFHGRLRALVRAQRQGRRFATRLDFLMSRSVSQEAAQLAKRLELPADQAEAHMLRLQREAESWVKARHPRQPVQPTPSRPAATLSPLEKKRGGGLPAAARPGRADPARHGSAGLRGRGQRQAAGLPDRDLATPGGAAGGHRHLAIERRQVRPDRPHRATDAGGGGGALLAHHGAGHRQPREGRAQEKAPHPGREGGWRGIGRLSDPRAPLAPQVQDAGARERPGHRPDPEPAQGGGGSHRLSRDDHQPQHQPRERHPLL